MVAIPGGASFVMATIQNHTGGWTDVERLSYLVNLDEDPEQEVSHWEGEFISSVLTLADRCTRNKRDFVLSEKQRQVVENLYQKYRS